MNIKITTPEDMRMDSISKEIDIKLLIEEIETAFLNKPKGYDSYTIDIDKLKKRYSDEVLDDVKDIYNKKWMSVIIGQTYILFS